MLATILLMFVFFFIRMVIPLSIAEGAVWIFVVETYVLSFVIIRNKLRDKHRKAVRNVKFCYAGVWRDFVYYEKMLLGVTQWYQIDIDWSDQMLEELFSSNFFKQLKTEIINWHKIEAFQRPASLPKSLYDKEIEDEIGKELVENLPFSSFNIDQITNTIKKKLKKLNIHIGILSEPAKYKDSEITFDRICLFTETDIEKSLKCKASFAVHEGYPVEIDQVECAFAQLGWLLPEIPVYYLTWSENITKTILEPALDSLSIVYIEMKVLEKFVYTLRAFSQHAAMALKQEETKSNMYYDAWDDIIQELEIINIREVLGSKDLDRLKLESEAKKAGKFKYVSYALAAFVVILMIFVILMLVSSNSSTPIPPGDSTNTASILLNIFRIFGGI